MDGKRSNRCGSPGNILAVRDAQPDVPQIAVNQRFALFFPEKRPFFLEGLDLFSTPIQAVYTRIITAPTAGGSIATPAQGV